MAVCTCGIAGGAFAQGIAPAVPDKKEEKRVLEVGKWYPRLESGLNLTQSSYSENWKGGETGSVAWSACMNGSAERQINSSLNWLNTMKLLYGQTRREEVGADGDRHWGDAGKSADQVDVESLFRLTKGWAVDPYLSLRWESLFQDVTDPYGRKLWFNPMTFKESAGIARKFVDQRIGIRGKRRQPACAIHQSRGFRVATQSAVSFGEQTESRAKLRRRRAHAADRPGNTGPAQVRQVP